MRLAVFGATGRTGRVVVERALTDGHEVSALTRDAGRIPPRERLRVVTGDVRDPAAVAETVAGAEAVVSALGRQRTGPETCTEGVRTILSQGAHGGAPAGQRRGVDPGPRPGPHRRSRTGAYRAGVDLRLGFTSRVSRADVAEFMLGAAQSRDHVRRAVAITS